MSGINKKMDKEKPKAKNDIEDLKYLVKRKIIQNNALQKIIENLKSNNNNNC